MGVWGKIPQRLYAHMHRLKQAEIECRPALDVISEYNREDILLYIDPPYDPDTRHKNIYPHEMTVDDHKNLLDILVKHKGAVVLSGYDNALYTQTLSSWKRFQRMTLTERGKVENETLWIKS